MSIPEISCPKCRWRPKATDRWVCDQKLGGCGTIWHTFDTRGVCPTCSWNWIITQCFSCKQFSPHEEWYHEPISEMDEAHEETQVLVDA
jgi:hypothetical protein